MSSDEAWRTFAEINELIRFADTKAAVLLVTGGALGGLLVNAMPRSLPAAGGGVRVVAFVLAAATVAVSVGLSLLALRPQLGGRDGATSLIYFDHIARRFRHDRDGFVEAFAAATGTPATLNREVGHQIWANSLIARRKFRHVTSATWLLGVAMFGSGMALLLQHTPL